jgi:hypothetical protein
MVLRGLSGGLDGACARLSQSEPIPAESAPGQFAGAGSVARARTVPPLMVRGAGAPRWSPTRTETFAWPRIFHPVNGNEARCAVSRAQNSSAIYASYANRCLVRSPQVNLMSRPIGHRWPNCWPTAVSNRAIHYEENRRQMTEEHGGPASRGGCANISRSFMPRCMMNRFSSGGAALS